MNKYLLLIFAIIFTFSASSQIKLDPVVDSIPMRDGKKLAADIYLPDTGKQYPVILIQTPYNRQLYRWNLPLVGREIKNSPYAFVIVDWRCFYGSTKACTAQADRGKDGYDVIDWIVQQAWSDGKIGTWGPSALGKIQFMTAAEQHPNHICAVPIVAAPQYDYEEYFPGGVYRREYVEQLDALGYGMSKILLEHPYYDVFWQIAENQTFYPEKIEIPMLLIGGWFDHNTDLTFTIFEAMLKSSATSVRDQHKFLAGPWSHNSVGKAQVGELNFPQALGVSDSFAWLFFDYYLRGAKNGYPLNEKFIMGKTNVGKQTSVTFYPQKSFPIDEYQDTFFLSATYSSLFLTQPEIHDSISMTYDPKDPSPTIGGPTLRADLKQGPVKINELFDRDDQLAFTFPSGDMNTLNFEGKAKLHLFVSCDRKDTDFAVRLAFKQQQTGDVYILSDGIIRGRFRNGFTTMDTQFFDKGKIYEVVIDLPPHFLDVIGVFYLIISNSNYPRFDLNLNNGGELYKAGDTLVATSYIHTGGAYPSMLVFDGRATMSGIAGQSKDMQVYVYPNPAFDEITIQLPESKTQHARFEIFDAQGQRQMSAELLPGYNKLSINDLKPQLYFIRIYVDDELLMRKFIKL